MRVILLSIVLLIISAGLKAQTSSLRFNSFSYQPVPAYNINDSIFNKKWFLTHYTGISTSFNIFRGGNATVVSAPLGVQLSRRLNNNLYAFAGVSAAPAYVNFNGHFLSADANKSLQSNSFNSNSFGIYSRAEMGLMYVNDARTFSISGSISVERNNYPYPYSQPYISRQNVANTSGKR